MDLYYGHYAYSTCVTQAGSLTKRQKGEPFLPSFQESLFLS